MTLYEVLGVPAGATPEEIKSAWRSAAQRVHPDKGGSEEGFKLVQKAYDILSDPGRRAKYDATGEDGGPKTARQKAIEILPVLMSEVLDESDVAGPVLERAAAKITAEMTKLNKLGCNAAKRIKVRESALKRLGVKPGKADFISQSLTAAIAGLSAELGQLQESEEIFKEVLALLSDHTYETDPSEVVTGEKLIKLTQEQFSRLFKM